MTPDISDADPFYISSDGLLTPSIFAYPMYVSAYGGKSILTNNDPGAIMGMLASGDEVGYSIIASVQDALTTYAGAFAVNIVPV